MRNTQGLQNSSNKEMRILDYAYLKGHVVYLDKILLNLRRNFWKNLILFLYHRLMTYYYQLHWSLKLPFIWAYPRTSECSIILLVCQHFLECLPSLETFSDTRVLLLHPAWFWFLYKLMFISPKMYNSFLRISNLVKFSFRVCRNCFGLEVG